MRSRLPISIPASSRKRWWSAFVRLGLVVSALMVMSVWNVSWEGQCSMAEAEDTGISVVFGAEQGDRDMPLAIEWLEFQVDANERDAFLKRDREVWTAALQQQPGFLHKSVLLSPTDPKFVGFVIYWASREAWDAFPEDAIVELDRQMQPTSAVLVRGLEYSSWDIPPFLQQPSDLEGNRLQG